MHITQGTKQDFKKRSDIWLYFNHLRKKEGDKEGGKERGKEEVREIRSQGEAEDPVETGRFEGLLQLGLENMYVHMCVNVHTI